MKGTMAPSEQVELTATVHQEDGIHQEDGMYWAEVADHPGLFASGETMDELIEALGAWVTNPPGGVRRV
jgi:predicted RNase H-like HicB family nuclease